MRAFPQDGGCLCGDLRYTVTEDPATGSANAGLANILASLSEEQDATLEWTVAQGIEVGRPSLLHVEADRSGGETSAVRVGGGAVFVSEGVMRVPDTT